MRGGQGIRAREIPDRAITTQPRDKGGAIRSLAISRDETLRFQFRRDLGAPEGTDEHVVRQAVSGVSTCTRAASQTMMSVGGHGLATTTSVGPNQEGAKEKPDRNTQFVPTETKNERAGWQSM